MGKASDTGGVKPMAIEGRMANIRERLIGMTDEERAYRKQWLKDQILSPDEPRVVPEMYAATHNPIRRFYRYPLNRVQVALEPVLGKQRALKIRYFTGKILLGIAGTYLTAYYFMYNGNDWTRQGGWRVIQSRKAVLEGDPGYPAVSDRQEGADYADRGFKQVTLNL